ncbi:hypothetical protein GCM10023238_07030 [Streptomyces heliomycini]
MVDWWLESEPGAAARHMVVTPVGALVHRRREGTPGAAGVKCRAEYLRSSTSRVHPVRENLARLREPLPSAHALLALRVIRPRSGGLDASPGASRCAGAEPVFAVLP